MDLADWPTGLLPAFFRTARMSMMPRSKAITAASVGLARTAATNKRVMDDMALNKRGSGNLVQPDAVIRTIRQIGRAPVLSSGTN
jgi:hypothetical protein